MMKRILAALLTAVIVVMTVAVTLGVVSTAASATIAYSFLGDNAADRGYAQGTITVTAGPDSGGSYYLYWADDTAILPGYQYLGYITVAGSASGSFGMPAYTAIPSNAKKLVAFIGNNTGSGLVSAADAVYDIPENKTIGHSSDEMLYSFASYSDFHLSADKTGSSSNYPYDEAHEAEAWAVAKDHDVDFVVTTGDHVNNQRNDSNGGNNDFYADEWNTYLRILAESDYTGPVYEAIGNHELWNYDTESDYANKDWQTGYDYFVTVTGLSGSASDIASSKAYYEMTEPHTGDHFLFMALEGGFYTDRVNEFSTAQLNWLESKLSAYENDGKNTFVLEHANFYKWGAGDQLDNPIYDIPLKDTNTSTQQLKTILSKYKNATILTGHTHFKLALGLNYSTNNGTSMTMVHNSAVGAVRNITNRTTRVNDKSEDQTEGYIVEVYDNAVIYHGINLYYNEIIPTCTYIVPSATSVEPSTEPSTAPSTAPSIAPSTEPSTAPSIAPSTDMTADESTGETAEPILFGDVDGNGDVEITDATWIQQSLAHMRTLSDAQQACGKVAGDSFLSITDATLIQQYLAHIIHVFPAEDIAAVAASAPTSQQDATDAPAAVGAAIDTLRTQANAALTDYYLLASYPQYAALKKAVREGADYDTLYDAYIALSTVVSDCYAGDTVTVYFTNNQKWSSVYAYCYADRNTKNAEWPGKACTRVGTNGYNETIYSITVPTGLYNYIIFTDGTNKTQDLALPIVNGRQYYTTGSTINSSGETIYKCASTTYTR